MPLKSPAIASEAFTDDNVPAFVLYSICVGQFGGDIHEWEPETLWLEIQDEFKVECSESNKDKLQAAITLVVTNKFYENFRVFEGIGKAFSNQSPNFEWVTPLTPEECAWVVAEARLIDSTPEEYSLEVKAYVREVLREGGLYMSPPQLAFCNIATVYPAEKYVPNSLRKKVEHQQKIKLKKTELYIHVQRDAIQKNLKKYL